MTTTKRITNFSVSWQADHAQYWQGHGIALTNYTHCATGCGDTLREAFEDALEDLAQQGIELQPTPSAFPEDDIDKQMLADLTSQVKEPDMIDMDIVQAYCDAKGQHRRECEHGVDPDECIEEEHINTSYDSEKDDCAICAGEWNFYVSIDVTVEEL